MAVLSIEHALRELENLSRLDAQLEVQRRSSLGLGSLSDSDESDELIQRMLENNAKKRTSLIRTLLRYPPHHNRHNDLLEPFSQHGAYEDSVFIMTKFPEGDSPDDRALGAVIQAVRDGIEASGKKARLASDREYHSQLWDNVELYLLGSARGVAIVEDKYRAELNPNVAMEWGWMRGMGRRVLFLVEQDFKHFRADWGGLLKRSFDWNDPSRIPGEIQSWLADTDLRSDG
ncbi:MAG: hypothetical protein AAGD38_18270 [Acidobacteriota bacterium]